MENNNAPGNRSIIQEVAGGLKAGEVVVFCGAGISVNSGIPATIPLIRSILDKLAFPVHEQQMLLGPKLSDLRIPFEAFMQDIQKNTDPSPLYNIYELGEPNTNHFLLAYLMKAGQIKTIVTTNFDKLIEKALEQKFGWRPGREYDLFYTEEQSKVIDWNSSKPRLVKLHGSVDDKKNMAITIEQVAKKELSEARKGIVDHVYSTGAHKTVLLLGYSCSDVFDISPHITAVEGERKKVICLEHTAQDKSPAAERLAERETKNPFRNFEGVRLFCNTDKFIEELWKELIQYKYVSLKSAVSWQSNVDAWAVSAPEGMKYNVSGILLWELSEYNLAEKYFYKALESARTTGEKVYMDTCLMNLGCVYLEHGKHREGITYLTEALNITREIRDQQGEVKCLGNLGVACSQIGEFREAVSYLNLAIVIAKAMGDKEGEGKYFLNLGSAYIDMGEYQKAIEFIDKALFISREIGDKHCEGSSLIGLGNAYLGLGKYGEAVTNYTKGLTLNREIGNKGNERKYIGQLANACCLLGRDQEAITYYTEALAITRETDDKLNEGNFLSELGQIYSRIHRYPEAAAFFSDAVEIMRAIGDKEGEGVFLSQLGKIYNAIKKPQEAVKYLTRALEIARMIDHKHGTAECLVELGNAYCILNNYQEAMKYLNEALELTRATNYKSCEGHCLQIMGNACYWDRRFQEAVTHYASVVEIARMDGNKGVEGNCLGALGDAYFGVGKMNDLQSGLCTVDGSMQEEESYLEAAKCYNEALGIARELGNKPDEGNYHNKLGAVYDELEDYSQSLSHFDQAYEIYYTICGANHPATQSSENHRRMIRALMQNGSSYR